MSEAGSRQETRASAVRGLLLGLVAIATLVAVLVLTLGIGEDTALGFIVPYKSYLIACEVAILGVVATELAGRWLYRLLLRSMSSDSAAAVRAVLRIVAYGVLLSAVVSLITANITAALTTGAFAGMVAGLAAQTVIGNAVAGVFIALYRPVRVGDNVTVAGNTGKVVGITMMHIILDAGDREIMIPSSQIVNSVLVRHKPGGQETA